MPHIDNNVEPPSGVPDLMGAYSLLSQIVNRNSVNSYGNIALQMRLNMMLKEREHYIKSLLDVQQQQPATMPPSSQQPNSVSTSSHPSSPSSSTSHDSGGGSVAIFKTPASPSPPDMTTNVNSTSNTTLSPPFGGAFPGTSSVTSLLGRSLLDPNNNSITSQRECDFLFKLFSYFRKKTFYSFRTQNTFFPSLSFWLFLFTLYIFRSPERLNSYSRAAKTFPFLLKYCFLFFLLPRRLFHSNWLHDHCLTLSISS